MTPMAPAGADPAAMAVLHARCFPDMRGWRTEEFAALLAESGVIAATAPSGFALARVAADEAELLTIAVDPDRRGAGQGGALLAEVLAGAAARGAARVFLEVAADNHAALSLYDRAGFTTCGRRRGYYRRPGGAVDALIMARDIG